MKKTAFILITVFLALAACSPVLNRELMKQGTREVPMDRLREAPDAYRGKLYILGGLIVGTRLVEKGSEIEALAVPVDSLGYPEDLGRASGRFLAFYPRAKGLLDPIVFRKGREITMAGEFVEVRKGKIDEMEYVYPVFEIREIYLWDERRDVYWPVYPYAYYNDPFYYRSPFLYDAWGRPYPGPNPYHYGLPPW